MRRARLGAGARAAGRMLAAALLLAGCRGTATPAAHASTPASEPGVAPALAPDLAPDLAPAEAVRRAAAHPAVVLDPEDLLRALEFSPLPPVPPDPTNAVADDPAAAALGQALFFDPRLSGPGTVSCATCHDPAQGFGDGRRLARGLAHHPRHTMTLWNVAHQRWFFWDGRKDSLWSQALSPIEDPREQGGSRLQAAHLVAREPAYARAYEAVFGPLPALSDAARFPPAGRPVPEDEDDPLALAWAGMAPADRDAVDRVFANVGKAIAAYERRLVAGDSAFDRFVAAVRAGDADGLAALPADAQRGFALFAGEARCAICHDGPLFSDKEFHANRVRTGEGTDPGRGLGVVRLLADPFNTASPFADDGGTTARTKLALPRPVWEIPGTWRTPSLRNVALTAPYMHEGQLDTLEQVVDFYADLADAEPPGTHDERILRPLGLDAGQRADLVAFLRALTDEAVPAELLRAPGADATMPPPPAGSGAR